MLDVARHFFGVDDVKRFVDVIARYGFNRLHLHLTDDQGWRIEIKSWPRLAEVGGATRSVAAPAAGTRRTQYAELVSFAAERDVVVVPGDRPAGHVNAALVAYPELAPAASCRRRTRAPTWASAPSTDERRHVYAFVEDVVREVAELTPGAYFHIGGDEAAATPSADYIRFVERVGEIVSARGKRLVGWEEIARARLPAGTIVQHWKDPELLQRAVEQGASVVMSPASRAYLDMKYDEEDARWERPGPATSACATRTSGIPETCSASRRRSGRRL